MAEKEEARDDAAAGGTDICRADLIDPPSFWPLPKLGKIVDNTTDGDASTSHKYRTISEGVIMLHGSLGSREKTSEQSSYHLEPYPMLCSPHGRAVVISNDTFSQNSARSGNEVDEKNIIQTFTYLRYIVEVYRNVSASDMELLMEAVGRADHSSYDSFVCCILSHGEAGRAIVGSDSKKIKLTKLTQKVSVRNSPSLAGKPKMFFIQACAGKRRDIGEMVPKYKSTHVRADEGFDETDGHAQISENEPDFIISHSTPDGYVSWRDPLKGSWYVSELSKVLCTHALHSELHWMLVVVNSKVSEKRTKKRTKTKTEWMESPEFRSSLQKPVYFFTQSS